MSHSPIDVRKPSLLALAMFAATGCGEQAPQPETPDGLAIGAPPIVAVAPAADGIPPVEEPDDAGAARCDVACAEDGLCTKMDGACVAMEDAHCRQSNACRKEGRCAAEDHQCVEAGHGCSAVIAAMRACMAKMPPDAQQSLTTAIEALETAMKIEEPEAQQMLNESCQHMLTSLAGSGLCP